MSKQMNERMNKPMRQPMKNAQSATRLSRLSVTLSVTLWMTTLAACSPMIPAPAKVDAQLPQTLPASTTVAGQNTQALDIAAAPQSSLDERWRKVFTEPRQQKMIELALQNNRDARVAVLNVERARALYQVQEADFYPDIDGRAIGSRQRTSEALGNNRNNSSSGGSGGSGSNGTPQSVRASIGFSAYELDLFGRIRSLNEEALQRYMATESALNAAKLSLIAEVALADINLATNQARVTLAQLNVSGLQRAFKLVSKRKELGVSSELDLSLARNNMELARIALAQAQRSLEQNTNALRILLGGDIPKDLLIPQPTENEVLEEIAKAGANLREGRLVWPTIPADVQSDVLLNRPDLQQAESLLKASNARIGAARAAFFPSISLTAEVGSASTSLNGLFESGSRTWLFSPEIRIPIFDGGRNLANLKVAETDQQIALAQYEKSIQTAFREVADVLAEQDSLRREYESRAIVIRNAQNGYKLAEARFNQGIDSYLVVIETQRQWIAAQQGYLDTRQRRANMRVMLFKTLGGI
ncbi:MAG: efflux transporter outer membrane subunit [Limnobacter sp.]|nr:efflux transporter outer membrane subunit [Limnobacter sp.]